LVSHGSYLQESSEEYGEKFLSSAEFRNQFKESWLAKLVSIRNVTTPMMSIFKTRGKLHAITIWIKANGLNGLHTRSKMTTDFAYEFYQHYLTLGIDILTKA